MNKESQTTTQALEAARADLCQAIGLSQAQFATTGLDGGALITAIDTFEATIRDALTGADRALAEMEARKDGAYFERNQVVAALAKCFPSGIAKTAIEGWSEDWHGCVYIDLPTGQVSWHYHDSQAFLFEGLPSYVGQWDGHTTEEKYARLSALTGAGQRDARVADDGRRHYLAAQIVAVGHNDDCLFCGFKDKIAKAALETPAPTTLGSDGGECPYCNGTTIVHVDGLPREQPCVGCDAGIDANIAWKLRHD